MENGQVHKHFTNRPVVIPESFSCIYEAADKEKNCTCLSSACIPVHILKEVLLGGGHFNDSARCSVGFQMFIVR